MGDGRRRKIERVQAFRKVNWFDCVASTRVLAVSWRAPAGMELPSLARRGSDSPGFCVHPRLVLIRQLYAEPARGARTAGEDLRVDELIILFFEKVVAVECHHT